MVEERAWKFDVSTFEIETKPRTPEERLMVAVLEEALMTFERGLHSHDPLQRQASLEVERWVRSREADDLFSFECVCTILGLDADYLRAGFVSLRRSATSDARERRVRKVRRERPTNRIWWRGRIG